jgi:hypothetical protein
MLLSYCALSTMAAPSRHGDFENLRDLMDIQYPGHGPDQLSQRTFTALDNRRSTWSQRSTRGDHRVLRFFVVHGRQRTSLMDSLQTLKDTNKLKP